MSFMAPSCLANFNPDAGAERMEIVPGMDWSEAELNCSLSDARPQQLSKHQ